MSILIQHFVLLSTSRWCKTAPQTWIPISKWWSLVKTPRTWYKNTNV